MGGVVVVDVDDAVRGVQIGESALAEEVLQHDQRIEQGGTGLACGTLDLPQPEVVVGHHRQPLLRDSADHVGQ